MSIGCLRPDWPVPAGVHAAFTWREGGASQPPCDAFNLALHVGDDPVAVAANRAALRTALHLPCEPQWLQQVHGAEVLRIEAPLAMEAPPVADAAVTRLPGVPLAIMVADCLPVLLASSDGRVIGAAHAGWRGLASGVIEATVRAMATPGAELCAWLGPCIRQPRFEVGADVRAAFIDASGAVGSEEHRTTMAAFAANARGRWQCDLAALARLRLRRAGVAVIADCGICTHDDRAHCFSHRRDGRTGRMAALLWLQA